MIVPPPGAALAMASPPEPRQPPASAAPPPASAAPPQASAAPPPPPKDLPLVPKARPRPGEVATAPPAPWRKQPEHLPAEQPLRVEFTPAPPKTTSGPAPPWRKPEQPSAEQPLQFEFPPAPPQTKQPLDPRLHGKLTQWPAHWLAPRPVEHTAQHKGGAASLTTHPVEHTQAEHMQPPQPLAQQPTVQLPADRTDESQPGILAAEPTQSADRPLAGSQHARAQKVHTAQQAGATLTMQQLVEHQADGAQPPPAEHTQFLAQQSIAQLPAENTEESQPGIAAAEPAQSAEFPLDALPQATQQIMEHVAQHVHRAQQGGASLTGQPLVEHQAEHQPPQAEHTQPLAQQPTAQFPAENTQASKPGHAAAEPPQSAELPLAAPPQATQQPVEHTGQHVHQAQQGGASSTMQPLDEAERSQPPAAEHTAPLAQQATSQLPPENTQASQPGIAVEPPQSAERPLAAPPKATQQPTEHVHQARQAGASLSEAERRQPPAAEIAQSPAENAPSQPRIEAAALAAPQLRQQLMARLEQQLASSSEFDISLARISALATTTASTLARAQHQLNELRQMIAVATALRR